MPPQDKTIVEAEALLVYTQPDIVNDVTELNIHELRDLATSTTKCTKDTDCDDYPYFRCGVKTPGTCSHKKVFPATHLEIGGWFAFAFFKALCNIAGIGGGSVTVPMDMLFFHFGTKAAVAVSSFTIFTTSLATFFLNFRSRHPEKPNMVLIDYNIVTIMMGTTLAGA